MNSFHPCLNNEITAKLLLFLRISFLTEKLPYRKTFWAQVPSSGPLFCKVVMGRILVILGYNYTVRFIARFFCTDARLLCEFERDKI